MARCLLTPLSLAGLLISSGAGCSPGTSPAKPKYTIRHTYEVGDRLLLTQKTTGDATIRFPAGPRAGAPEGPIVRRAIKQNIEVCVQVALEVSRAAKPGWKDITLRVRRIRGRWTESGEEEEAFDTDRPQALKQKEQVKALQEIKDALVKAQLNARGGIVSIKGTEELTEALIKVHPKFRDEGPEKAAVGKAVAASIGQLLLWRRASLASRRVSVYDTWQVKRKLYPPSLAGLPTETIAEDTRCKLVSVGRTPAGRIATVMVSGRWRDPDEDINVTETGQVDFNIDKNALVSHRIKLEANGSLKDGSSIVGKVIIATELAKDPAPGREKPVQPATRPK